jgi:hypothetical protein
VTDREFLCWIHEWLVLQHGENPLLDYMHKFRAIIARTPKERCTPNRGSSNSLEQLLRELDEKEAARKAAR